MPLNDYRDDELEANWHFPVQSSHHTHFPRGFDRKRIMEILESENLGELESGQIPLWPNLPVNTLK